MDNPAELQESGAGIDWDEYSIKPRGKGMIADATFDEEAIICDYVPACSMLVRADAVRKTGLMDETNYIYWDDIEWAYRMRQSGYEVTVLPSSKAWHKMGASRSPDTFGTYYFWRNRLNFFLENLPDDDLPRFAKKIFAELFQAVYACNFNKKYQSAQTILFAAADALSGVRGKAPEGRIVAADPVSRKLENLLKDQKTVVVTDFEDIKTLRDVIGGVRKAQPTTGVALTAGFHDSTFLAEQFPGIKIIAGEEHGGGDFPMTLRVCRHVMELDDRTKPGIHIDRYLNLVASPSDLSYVASFSTALKAAEAMIYPVFLDRALSFKNTKASGACPGWTWRPPIPSARISR